MRLHIIAISTAIFFITDSLTAPVGPLGAGIATQLIPDTATQLASKVGGAAIGVEQNVQGFRDSAHGQVDTVKSTLESVSPGTQDTSTLQKRDGTSNIITHGVSGLSEGGKNVVGSKVGTFQRKRGLDNLIGATAPSGQDGSSDITSQLASVNSLANTNSLSLESIASTDSQTGKKQTKDSGSTIAKNTGVDSVLNQVSSLKSNVDHVASGLGLSATHLVTKRSGGHLVSKRSEGNTGGNTGGNTLGGDVIDLKAVTDNLSTVQTTAQEIVKQATNGVSKRDNGAAAGASEGFSAAGDAIKSVAGLATGGLSA